MSGLVRACCFRPRGWALPGAWGASLASQQPPWGHEKGLTQTAVTDTSISQHRRTREEQKQVEFWLLFSLCTSFSPREPRSTNTALSPSKELGPGPSSGTRTRLPPVTKAAKFSPDLSSRSTGQSGRVRHEGSACRLPGEESPSRPDVPSVRVPRPQQPGMQAGRRGPLARAWVTRCGTDGKAVHLPGARPGFPRTRQHQEPEDRQSCSSL